MVLRNGHLHTVVYVVKNRAPNTVVKWYFREVVKLIDSAHKVLVKFGFVLVLNSTSVYMYIQYSSIDA